MPENLSDRLDRYNRNAYTSQDALWIQECIISVKKNLDAGFCDVASCLECPLQYDRKAPCTIFAGSSKPRDYGQLKLDYMLTWLENHFPKYDFMEKYRALCSETERLIEERYAKEPL